MRKAILNSTLTLFLFLISCNIDGQVISNTIDSNYKCLALIDSVDGKPVFIICEKMPEFPGGEEARLRFLMDKIHHPGFDKNDNFQDLVYLTFIIDTSGNVTNICVKRNQFSEEFTRTEIECMRVLALMPKWKPGEQNGKPVPVRFDMPVRFHPNKE